jgi:HD-like signal output (HDOD) protein
MSAPSSEFSSQVQHAIDRMPAFPASVQSILRLTRNASCAPRDLVEVIDRDPIVTLKVLRVVNSAYYSLPRPITSIDHAVVFLGFNTIKNLALSIAALSLLPPNLHPAFDARDYLHHSLATAAIARQLGQRFADIEAHDFFIAGLLHDFGKVVLAQVMPMAYQQALEYGAWHEVPQHQALLHVTGIAHAEVGAMLLEQWHFPPALAEALRWQYMGEPRESALAVCVCAANQIAKTIGANFGNPAPIPPLPAPVVARLGGTLREIMESLGDLTAILHEAGQFSELQG